MARNVFSVPIFFIVFRETLEAVIIVSVLLGLVEQIVHTDSGRLQGETTSPSLVEGSDQKENGVVTSQGVSESEDDSLRKRRLVRKMRFQVHSGVATERADVVTPPPRSLLVLRLAFSLLLPLVQRSLPSGSLKLPISGKNLKQSGRVSVLWRWLHHVLTNDNYRYILAYRLHLDLYYGYWYAQVEPGQG